MVLIGSLKVTAFLAFIVTFTNYNKGWMELGEFMGLAESITFTVLLTTIAEQFQNTTEDIYARDDSPFGQASVNLISGSTILGSQNPLTTAFYNIRYAQPPVGSLRFSDPEPYEQPSFVDASVRRQIVCPQKCEEPTCKGEVSEDCLYLNVHVPSSYSLGSSEKLPVMVWIHGGAFFQGSGSDDLYDVISLSNATGTIVVSLNYRLGWLGFLPYEKEGISGNQGIKDQRMALKWVYDNIEAFGGDQNQITIFGESAGGQSVLFHVVSEKSSPYYQRAIIQSQLAYPFQNKQEWNKITDLLLTQFKLRFKCHLFSGLDCLRNLPIEDFLELHDLESANARSLAGARTYFVPSALESQMHVLMELTQPMIDGVEFTTNPLQMIETGQWNSDKDIIIGNTNGEGNFLYDYAGLDRDGLQGSAAGMFGEYTGAAALEAYEGFLPNASFGELFGDMQLHAQYTCYARALARKMAATGSGKVFLYEFAQPYQVRDPETGELIVPKVLHAHELGYLFRNKMPYFDLYRGTESDLQAMEMMSDYWGSFARDGFPNSDKYSPWPEYKDQGRWNMLRIAAPDATILDNMYDDECAFWEAAGRYSRS